MERDLTSSVDPKVAFTSQLISSSTTTAGSIIDTKGFESVDISVLSATLTDGDYEVTISAGDAVDNESAPTSITDAASVDSDLIIGSLPSFADTEDDTVKHFGTVTKKRWFQISVVSTGVSDGGTLAAIATLGNAASRPTV